MKRKAKGQIFSPNDNDKFSVIINHLRGKSNNNIDKEIEITDSSINKSGELYQPNTVAWKENINYCFVSKNIEGSWLRIDFKEHKIIPTHYTIRSFNWSPGWDHPKSWAFEVSNDNKTWSIIDEVTNFSQLNGKRLVHTLKIQNEQSNDFRYIRIHQTGTNWKNNNYFGFETIEIYGTLI